MKRVSIIIPVYNAEAYLREALDSALGQSWPEVEVIAVNDGSTDGSGEILEEYAQAGRIRIIEQENAGQSAASNRGTEAATGDFIKFFDADDVLSPNHLEAQVRSLQGTSAHLSACQPSAFVDDPARSRRREAVTDRDEDEPLAWILDAMEFDEGMMPGWRWLIPRTVLEAAGGWDERLSLNNDFEFSIRLLLHSNGVRYAPEAVVHYRQAVSGSLSGRASRAAMESAWRTTRLGSAMILERDDGLRARRLCADRMQAWLYRFYPAHSELAAEAEAEIERLGGSSRPLQGGRLLRLLSHVLTWRQIRRLQELAYGSGWRRVLDAKSAQRKKRLAQG